jgi:cytochrome c biogenesis protein
VAADLDPFTAEAPVRPPTLGVVGAARWAWRQLTSMRVALILLFLLAVAAVPGSVFPQRGVSPLKVQDYFTDHPTWARLLDSLSMFDVYAAPWFAAIYLLLTVSLVGCIVPRVAAHARALRSLPPPAPRNLQRLPVHRSVVVDVADGRAVVDGMAKTLAGRRFRVRTADDGRSLAAEKGYLRESGNLVFHVSLLLLLVGLGVSALLGYKGTVVVVEGGGFSNTLSQYDTFQPGRRFDESMLAPFSFRLDALDATYLRDGPRRGQPSAFSADVSVTPSPGEPETPERISVNHPLEVDGSKVFLLGTGYAPRFTVRDGSGVVVFSGPVPTLPQDPAFTSTGVVKVPDARPDQLAFQVRFTPTAPLQVDPVLGPASTFPEDDAPRVYLGAWSGDLGLDDGRPQNIYTLDTSGLDQLGNRALDPGQTWRLPGGEGSVSFDGVSEFGNFQVARDPGRFWVLVGAVGAIGGVVVSLTVRRRRVWLRVTPEESGRTLVTVAGLARTEDAGLSAEVDQVVAWAVADDAPAGEEKR